MQYPRVCVRAGHTSLRISEAQLLDPEGLCAQSRLHILLFLSHLVHMYSTNQLTLSSLVPHLNRLLLNIQKHVREHAWLRTLWDTGKSGMYGDVQGLIANFENRSWCVLESPSTSEYVLNGKYFVTFFILGES